MGIKLSRANTVLFYSPEFSHIFMEQAKDRVIDVAKKDEVHYIYLLIKNTEDEHVMKVHDKSKFEAYELLDG